MQTEKSLVFIKPDGLIIKDLILEHLKNQGLSFVKIDEIVLREDLIRRFYNFLPEDTIQKCITYFGNKKLPVYIVSGENAIKKVQIIKNHLRTTHGNSRTGSIMHSTNAQDEFHDELNKLKIDL